MVRQFSKESLSESRKRSNSEGKSKSSLAEEQLRSCCSQDSTGLTSDDLDEEDRIEREIIKDELSRKIQTINNIKESSSLCKIFQICKKERDVSKVDLS